MLLKEQREALKRVNDQGEQPEPDQPSAEQTPGMLHWSRTPGVVDMGPYAQFYQDIVKDIATRTGGVMAVAEAGVRHGCSARIIMEALADAADVWHLDLIDPDPKPEAVALQADNRVTLHSAKAERMAPRFNDESFDLFHIDVDFDNTHPYELSYNVLLAWLPKLKPDGEIIIHDCTDHFPGIVRLVEEMKASGWDAVHCDPAPGCPIAAPVHLRPAGVAVSRDVTMVVPIIANKWLPALLENIKQMEHRPTEIIVIDNGNGVAKQTVKKFSDLPIRYLQQKKNLGVNASWNLGIAEAKTDLVAILNDDLVLPAEFFKAVQDTFMLYRHAGFVIPSTVSPPLKSGAPAPWKTGKPDETYSVDGLPHVVPVPRRDGGWCMTIRKSLVDPIPTESIFTFCGDDSIYRQIVSRGYWALRITDTVIYHEVGVSQDLGMRKKLKLPRTFQQEREAWTKILETQQHEQQQA